MAIGVSNSMKATILQSIGLIHTHYRYTRSHHDFPIFLFPSVGLVNESQESVRFFSSLDRVRPSSFFFEVTAAISCPTCSSTSPVSGNPSTVPSQASFL